MIYTNYLNSHHAIKTVLFLKYVKFGIFNFSILDFFYIKFLDFCLIIYISIIFILYIYNMNALNFSMNYFKFKAD